VTSTLFTGVLMIQTANSAQYTVSCDVLNVSSSRKTGTLQIIRADGTVLGSGGYNSVAPGVGTGIQVQTFQNTAIITTVYGKITVKGKPNSIRASLSLTDVKGNTLVSLEAR